MNKKVIYVFSDGTGETANTMVRAALVPFNVTDIQIIRCKNVRTEEQAKKLIKTLDPENTYVVHTVVSDQLRTAILETCNSMGILSIDLLGPLLSDLSDFLDLKPANIKVGHFRKVDEKYFKKIEAIEFTVKNDDGKILSDFEKADIILLGISRTSKTPLSIFLSHKGWKVANVPLVPNTPLPEELFNVSQKKIIGLLIDPETLYRIRRNRLEKFGQDPAGSYANLENIYKEIDFAKNLFNKNKRWPVLDVTERALEETAAEILKIISTRNGIPYGASL